MNITKYYPRIVKALYQSPWLVLPNTHETLRKAFEQHLLNNNGQYDMPMEPDDMPMEPDESGSMDGGSMDSGSMDMVPSTAIISVDGIIGKHLGMLDVLCGGVDVDSISEQLDLAVADPDISTVLLYLNTPGGTVTGVPELAEKIAEISKVKNTVAYVDVLCASAGYYLASQCNTIYAAPTAEVGSVGVYSIYFDTSVALANDGIKVNAISAGKYKLTGAPFRPMTDEERAMLQADIDKLYNQFKSVVTSKRAIADEDMQGQLFSGEDLINKNFIDGNLNSLGDVIQFLASK